MKARKVEGTIVITLGAGEAVVLRHALVSVASAYRTPPDKIDPRIGAMWYSTRGCRSADMSAEDVAEWISQMHAFKSGNLALVEGWLRQLAKGASRRTELALKLDHADAFVRVLNDHRLLAAAENDIGQDEMDLRDLGAAEELEPQRQTALVEIHFLAWIIEEILRLTAPDATRWGDLA